MPRRLTLKEKTFCEEYVANGGNASRAYQYAYGCSIEDARGRYGKTFRKPEVKEYIEALQKVAFENACITAERVALKLGEIAFADKGDKEYNTAAQLKALELLSKNMGLQKQNISADLHSTINIVIDE